MVSFVPTARDALLHPMFWSKPRMFGFIALVSESLYVRDHRASPDCEPYAIEIQRRFTKRLGVDRWGPLFPVLPNLGSDGWASPLWGWKVCS